MENPNAAAAPIVSDEVVVVADSGPQNDDLEFGFQRSEFGQEELAGTVNAHERHLFLCYKKPEVWPSHVEAAEFDRLPRLLAAALTGRKADIKKKAWASFS